MVLFSSASKSVLLQMKMLDWSITQRSFEERGGGGLGLGLELVGGELDLGRKAEWNVKRKIAEHYRLLLKKPLREVWALSSIIQRFVGKILMESYSN